ncbi:MAG: AAA family ATPase [Bacteroidales bacterium]|nr:AAA family ATPase [Bacteroidales bacterium]
MKLVSFNIQNYRSIIHSGWCNLAHDNITSLIGQNESGKTSVLEALNSFYTGEIHEDVLRSDLSLPIVSCKFELGKKKMTSFIDLSLLPDELHQVVGDARHFILTRCWKADRSAILFIGTEEILNYYEKKQVEKASIEEKTQVEIKKLLQEADKIFNEMAVAENLKEESKDQLTQSRKNLDRAGKTLRRSKKPDVKLVAEKELESLQKEYDLAEKFYTESVEKYEEKKQKTQQLSEKVTVCKACSEALQKLDKLKEQLHEYDILIRELDHQLEIATSEKDQRAAFTKIQKMKAELELVEREYQLHAKEEALHILVAGKVLSGTPYKAALQQALGEIEEESRLYTIFSIGDILHRQLPIFEFFEDFSSLLPNKIDLEDILIENSNVEGYKAARNFLEVAGLNAAFFREKNHRILKQKIENLNGEITINFQDYWSQNVGKNSKIRLNFELEHYDYTHPEKSGKPYLEFWIKDKNERLYPKQRSRGVRWFLSFYLELKATARKSNSQRILLIDEPGLSLHARAQEDVLKVFEDLKDSMQILYCTHSPHLIDTNKLYRILAVQRADEEDDRSESLILDPGSLHAASSDTLSPVYSLMGVKINNQDFIKAYNNFLVEDTLTYYYLNAFCQLAGIEDKPSFIPSTGLTNIPVLANILLGWKIDFSILVFGESRADAILSELAKSFFFAKEEEMKNKIVKMYEFEYPEDIFSTLDFKKYLLQRREGITQTNSEFILEQGLSRTILASQFINFCQDKSLTIKDFDDTTQGNIHKLLDKVVKQVP